MHSATFVVGCPKNKFLRNLYINNYSIETSLIYLFFFSIIKVDFLTDLVINAYTFLINAQRSQINYFDIFITFSDI